MHRFACCLVIAIFSLNCAYAAEQDQTPSNNEIQAAQDVAEAEKIALAYARATHNDRFDEAASYLSDTLIEYYTDHVYSEHSPKTQNIVNFFKEYYGEDVTLKHLRSIPARELYVLLTEGAMAKAFESGTKYYTVGDPVVLESTVIDPASVHVSILEKLGILGFEREIPSIWKMKKENGIWKLQKNERSMGSDDVKVKEMIKRKESEPDSFQCASRLTDAVFDPYKNLNEDFPRQYSGQGRASFGVLCYAGDFKQGKPAESGMYITQNGAEYTGELKKILPHGTGRYVDLSGWSYEGSWVNGMPTSGNCSYKGNTVPCKVIKKYKSLYTWQPYQKLMPRRISANFIPFAHNYDFYAGELQIGQE
jgi:hypothetical protein